MANAQEALLAIEEALEALSLESYVSTDGQHWVKGDPTLCTIGTELERIDAALGPKGSTVFFTMSTDIHRAITALIMARDALRG